MKLKRDYLPFVVMASGWGQGAGFGVGISTAVGMGAGNLIGALLSGVVAVPGVLIGSGVGAIHGPFVKLKDSISGKGSKKEEGKEKDELDEEIKEEVGVDSDDETDEDVKAHAAIVEEARKLNDGAQDEAESTGKDADATGTDEKISTGQHANDLVGSEEGEEKSAHDPPKD